MSQRVAVTVADPPARVAGASTVTVCLNDGRRLVHQVDEFEGTPARPLNRTELRDKFMMLMGSLPHGTAQVGDMFERLQNLESEKDVRWLGTS